MDGCFAHRRGALKSGHDAGHIPRNASAHQLRFRANAFRAAWGSGDPWSTSAARPKGAFARLAKCALQNKVPTTFVAGNQRIGETTVSSRT